MNKQVFLVTGIEPSKGDGVDQKTGRPFKWDSTNFYIQVPVKNGVGFKGSVQKLPSHLNYDRFKNVNVPCEMEFEFNLEFSGQFPKTTLLNVLEIKKV